MTRFATGLDWKWFELFGDLDLAEANKPQSLAHLTRDWGKPSEHYRREQAQRLAVEERLTRRRAA